MTPALTFFFFFDMKTYFLLDPLYHSLTQTIIHHCVCFYNVMVNWRPFIFLVLAKGYSVINIHNPILITHFISLVGIELFFFLNSGNYAIVSSSVHFFCRGMCQSLETWQSPSKSFVYLIISHFKKRKVKSIIGDITACFFFLFEGMCFREI